MQDHDNTEALQQNVKQAIENRQPVRIFAGNSKSFLGTGPAANPIDVSTHTGIVTYEPTELVITARAGTPLSAVNDELGRHGQMLAFEPPVFNGAATIGGTVASALSGPGRPYLGAVRDHVLGCRMINGQGQHLRFGGEVMKNVAGYDVTRLMTGSMGTLGLLLDLSLKVIPVAECTATVSIESDAYTAIKTMQSLAGKTPLVTASAWYEGKTSIRLAGVTSAVDAAISQLGGIVEEESGYWDSLKEQQHNFFNNSRPLWRLSVPALTPELDLNGDILYEWAGTQRWLFSDEDPERIRSVATQHQGHATLFKGDDELKRRVGSFQPPDQAILNLHRRLKLEFDPHSIFNPGRLYLDL